MCHTRTDRQIDEQTNGTDLIGPFLKRWRFDHVFRKFDNKIFLNYLTWLWAIRKESIQEKGIQTINIVQRLKCSKQWSLANLLKITFILFECHRSIANSIISLYYSERVHDNKEFNLKIHNLNVNPKSRPVKSNSEQHQFSFKYVSSKNQW